MTRNELANLVNDSEGVEVALALGPAPGEEAVAAENDSIAARIPLNYPAHSQTQLETGTQPGHPDQRVAEFAVELFHFGFAVGRGRQGDAPVRVKVVDMRKGKKAVQRRVDGGGNRIAAEGGLRVHRNHVVLGGDASVTALEGKKLLLVEGCKSRAANAAQIAARALDPKDLNRLAGTWIDFGDFRAGVAAGKVGDAQVGAKEVGAVAEQFRLVEGGGKGGIPAVFEELERGGSRRRLCHRDNFTGIKRAGQQVSKRNPKVTIVFHGFASEKGCFRTP